MGIGTIRSFCKVAVIAMWVALSFASPAQAEKTSSRPADLVNNDKVIYELPDVGSIAPENPLFLLKQIRDSFVLALPQDPISRARTLIQMSDKYTVYAQRLVSLSRIQRATQSFELSMEYQSSLERILEEQSARTSDEHYAHTITDLREIAMQSNIKQAEILREIIADVPSTEQPVFMELLDKNMQLRKRIQGTD